MVQESAGGRHRSRFGASERYLPARSCVFTDEMAEGTGLGVEERPAEASEPDVSDGGLDELYARHIGAGVCGSRSC